MNKLRDKFLLMCIFTVCASSAVLAESYRAGVALYKVVLAKPGATPQELIESNLNQYVKLIDSVKNKVDIVVFPEYGLTTLTPITSLKEHLKTYSTIVEAVGTQICNQSSTRILPRLACAAKANNQYVIVNLLENDNNDYYITNVCLDPSGSICLRCRKRHLYRETPFSAPPADDKACVFDAKINAATVTFSVLFDTDMLYEIPKELKHDNIIMTTSIVNSLPLEFGLSLEAGFSVGNDVNLLVSGFWDAKNNYGGSGIYHRNGTSVVGMSAEGVPDALNGSTILIEQMQLKPRDSRKVNFEAKPYGTIQPQNVNYKKIEGLGDMNKTVSEKCLNDNSLCCKFKAEVDQESIAPYRWVAISNKTTILNQTVDVFICALVKPTDGAKPIKFQKVSISSNLRKSEAVQSLPIALRKDFVPASFVYEEADAGTSITLNEEAELLMFGIVQVMPHKKSPSSNTALIVVIVLLVLVVLAVGGFLIWRKRQRKNRSAL
nr:vanin-like protein 3 [Leptinotarsa decemlineata]